jgi:hypothetical protein
MPHSNRATAKPLIDSLWLCPMWSERIGALRTGRGRHDVPHEQAPEVGRIPNVPSALHSFREVCAAKIEERCPPSWPDPILYRLQCLATDLSTSHGGRLTGWPARDAAQPPGSSSISAQGTHPGCQSAPRPGRHRPGPPAHPLAAAQSGSAGRHRGRLPATPTTDHANGGGPTGAQIACGAARDRADGLGDGNTGLRRAARSADVCDEFGRSV